MLNRAFIDRYNKTTVEYKKLFNQSFNLLQYYSDLKNLGFALIPTDKNFKYSKKYIDTKYLGSKGWTTSDNEGYIKRIRFWNKYAEPIQYKEKARFSPKELIAHTTSNKIKKLKKSIKKASYKEIYENRDDTRISFYNINHTLGACLKASNNILWFDIDDHNNEGIAKEKLNNLLKLLGVNISDALMIEQSQFNGGYHIAFKVNFTIKNNEFYKDLQKEIKNQIEGIDVNFSQTVLRLPLSYEYNPLKLDNIDEFYESFTDFHNSLDFNKTIDSYFLDRIFEPYLLESYADEMVQTSNDINKYHNKLSMDSVNKYLNRIKKHLDFWKGKKIIIKPKEIKLTNTLIDKSIYSGNRFEMVKKLVPYCVNNREFSLDETVDYIYKHNVSSKDINQFGKDGIKRTITGYYNRCVSNKEKGLYGAVNNISFELNKFVDNEKHIPTNILDILNNKTFQRQITNQFMDIYMSVRTNYDKSYKYTQLKKDNIYIQFPFILKQVVGSFYYQMNEINDKKSRCIDKKYNQYIGFQLSDIHLERIVNESKEIDGVVGSNKYTSFQIQYLKKAIYILMGLKSYNLITNIANCSRNYHKGFCVSFIANVNNIFNFFLRKMNLVKGYMDFNIIFSKIQNYIIYYITLVTNPLKKQDLLNQVIKLGKKMGIDPPPKIEFG